MSTTSGIKTRPGRRSGGRTVSTADRILHAVTWRLPSWLFHYYHAYLLATDSPKLIPRDHSTYFKRFASADDEPLMKKFGVLPAPAKERLGAGDRAVIMGRDNEILSIIWGSCQKCFLKLPGAILDPGETGMYAYAGFTAEKARLRGLYPASFAELYRHYLAQGRDRVFAAIHSTNTNSFELHRRMNFEIVGETYYLRFLGVNLCFYKTWPTPTRRFHLFLRRPPGRLHCV